MADGIFPSLVSKSRDVNAVANPIFVELSDGTAAVGVTSGSLDVNVANSSIAVTGTFYRDLVAGVAAGEDNVLIFANTNKDGSGTDYVPLVDTDGHLQVDVLDMPNLTLANDAVQVSANGTANSISNPIYVYVTSDVVLTNEIHDYDTSVNVAVDTADDHDYLVPSGTFLLKSVIVSASGNVKFEVKVGPAATLVTKAVGFLNGRQGDTRQLFFDPAIEVPTASTGTVRISRTNRQGATMDVYSTIIGKLL